MIAQPTHADVRHCNTRRTHKPEPRAWDAVSIGRSVRIGRGVRIGRESNSADPLTIFGALLLQYVRADMGITLASALKVTGTSPAASLSGTLTLGLGLRIKITTGGTLASTNVRFSWYTDGGTIPIATNVTAAATVGLTGAFSGVTVNFGSGTYVANDTYDATVATWADQIAVGTPHNYTVGGGAPVMVTSVTETNGKPGIRFFGANSDWMTSALTLAEPGTSPYTIAIVFRNDNHVSTNQLVSGTGSVGNANGVISMTGSGSTTGRFQQASPNIANTASYIPTGAAGVLIGYFSNSTDDYLRNGGGDKNNVSGAGVSAGNTASDISRRIGTNRTGSAFTDMTVLELLYLSGDFSTFHLRSYLPYVAKRYAV
jgi:hypothetical protein